MQARCYCKDHGRLDFDEIVIKNGTPICAKCSSPLEFGVVKPRKLNEGKNENRKRKN